MSITSIARLYFLKRQKELERHMNEGAQMQNDVLMSLLRRASDTEYGRNHIFNMTKSYEDFANNVPVNTYEELKGDIDRGCAMARNGKMVCQVFRYYQR